MKHLPEHQKGILAVLAAAILWSTGGMFIKLISLDALQLSFFRSVFAAAVFLFLLKKEILNINGFTFINALLYAAILILFVIATKMTTAANAIFLQYTAPIYVLIFEPLVNKTRYTRINIITIIICFLGMLLFFMGEITPGHLEGNLIALISGITFAALFLGMKKIDPKYQQSSIFWGNIIVALICIPFITSLELITFSDLWMVTFLGVFQIAIAYAFFASGIKRVIAVEASIISMVEPVFNPVWVFLGYGETPNIYSIIGGLIILGAIITRTLYTGSGLIMRRFKT